jgi:hypothetical protein
MTGSSLPVWDFGLQVPAYAFVGSNLVSQSAADNSRRAAIGSADKVARSAKVQMLAPCRLSMAGPMPYTQIIESFSGVPFEAPVPLAVMVMILHSINETTK